MDASPEPSAAQLIAELEATVLAAAQAAQQQSDEIRALEIAVAGLEPRR